jgi:ABC-2 type transport system permease protein
MKETLLIHDESGLFVKEFTSQNNKEEYKYLDLTAIDLKFQR